MDRVALRGTRRQVAALEERCRQAESRAVEQTEQQELDAHDYDAGGAIMVLVKAAMHVWGKPGVKGGEHMSFRTNKEWAWEVCECPFQ